MHTYKVTTTVKASWDQYLGFTVLAETEAQARSFVQDKFPYNETVDDDGDVWDFDADERHRWSDDNIVVTLVTEAGIAMSSFNNG